MAPLTWDQVGERTYETGVDRGVLYPIDSDTGEYTGGVAWNGLTTVTESPAGAEASAQYADNIKYLNLVSAETFGATIEAFTYPDEFAEMDGTALPEPGVAFGQQGRKVFGLSYRTRKGNDIDGTDHGYKLHLVYGCLAAPSEKAYGTINDSPEAIAFSWEVSTTPTPVAAAGLKPTALVVVDSTVVSASSLTALEDALYGGGTETVARLPLPDEVLTLITPGP
jgi:energy-converting hydrogenase Eha subunit A